MGPSNATARSIAGELFSSCRGTWLVLIYHAVGQISSSDDVSAATLEPPDRRQR